MVEWLPFKHDGRLNNPSNNATFRTFSLFPSNRNRVYCEDARLSRFTLQLRLRLIVPLCNRVIHDTPKSYDLFHLSRFNNPDIYPRLIRSSFHSRVLILKTKKKEKRKIPERLSRIKIKRYFQGNCELTLNCEETEFGARREREREKSGVNQLVCYNASITTRKNFSREIRRFTMFDLPG